MPTLRRPATIAAALAAAALALPALALTPTDAATAAAAAAAPSKRPLQGRAATVRGWPPRRHVATHGRPSRRRAVAHAAIIGGALAEADTFPQLAFIAYEKNRESAFTCTGTVVSPNVVLTAGHCVESAQTGEMHEPSGYVVVTGNVEWTASPRQVLGVSQVVVYPGFNRTTLAGDAALLILATPTSAPAIALASSPSDSARLEAGTEGILAGWGDTYLEQPTRPEKLSWARTVVQLASYCASRTSSFSAAYDICAIDPPNDKTGACYGDSGGPLITLGPSGSGYVELGLISRGPMECSTEYPTVFTRTDLIAPWVEEWTAASRTSVALLRQTPAPSTPANGRGPRAKRGRHRRGRPAHRIRRTRTHRIRRPRRGRRGRRGS